MKTIKITSAIFAISAFSILTGCMSAETKTVKLKYETLNAQCERGNIKSCFNAADYIWHLRASSLKPCTDNKILCIKTGETRDKAKTRLSLSAIEQNALACNVNKNAEACTRAGSGLVINGIKASNKDYKAISKRAEEFYQKGCKLGSKTACMFRGSSHRAGS